MSGDYLRQCARLDCNATFKADTRSEAQDQLAEHARSTGHWLCCICARSLPFDDDHTCLPCLGRAKRRLADIEVLYALLPGELGHMSRRSLLEDGPWQDHPYLDALVLLGPGSYGNVHRPDVEGLEDLPYPHGAPGRRRLRRRYVATENPDGGLPTDGHWVVDDEYDLYWRSPAHGINLATDPEAVWQTLSQWEDDFRSWLAQPPASDPTESLTAVVAYLMRHMDKAAQDHPGFPDLVDDLRRIHRSLEDATSHGHRPDRAAAPCFKCGHADLERTYRPPDACDHFPPQPQAWQLLAGPALEGSPWPIYRYLGRALGPLRHQDWVRFREPPDAEGKGGHDCDQGGRVDVWRCRTCGREYTPAEYLMALRAQLEEAATP